MGKYRHVVAIGIQNRLVYRVNFLFRSLFGLVPLIATIFLWKTIYAGKASGADVAGYALGQMISYYLVVTLVDGLTGVTEDDWQIAEDIREGNISQFLLKPIDYLAYRFCLFLAGRMIYMLMAIVPLAAFVFALRRYLVWPPGVLQWICFLGSCLLSGLLQFLISYTMALLAFWVLEVSTFILLVFALEYIAGGHMFPLDILPPALVTILKFTPFPYELFFPVSIYLGRSVGAELWQGLALQAFWVLAAFGVARTVWRLGIRRYSAFGG